MKVDFNKSEDGLVPVIVQNNKTLQVLMLGYMNQEAFEKTQKEEKVKRRFFHKAAKIRFLWTPQ